MRGYIQNHKKSKSYEVIKFAKIIGYLYNICPIIKYGYAEKHLVTKSVLI